MQRHHYVPQFYLREWYAPGKSAFWLYCRDNDGRLLFGHKSARSVGYQNGLYSKIPEIFGIGNSNLNEIEEKFFSPLDSAASRVNRKLIKSGPRDISSEDRLAWSLFVNSLLERSPTRINEIKEGAKIITEECTHELNEHFGMSKTDQRRFWKNIDISAITNNAVLSGMVKWICDEETINHFFNMRWVVTRLPEGKDHFLTGDTPVVINGASEVAPICALSLALSPSALLIMHTQDKEFDEDFIKKLTIMHSPLIAKQTKRYLVSSKELLDDGNVKYRRISNEIFSGSKTRA